MNSNNNRSKLDQIEDYHKAVSSIVYRGKTDSETTKLLLIRGLNAEATEELIQSVKSNYPGMKIFAPRKVIRFINSSIDMSLVISVMVILNVLFPEFLAGDGLLQWVLFFIFFFSYYITLEYFRGLTIGKLITDTRVVNENGQRPSLQQIILRTFFRLLPNAWWIDTVWHDKFSETFVVRRKALAKFKDSQAIA